MVSGKRVVLSQGVFYVTAIEETIAFKLSYGTPQDIEDVRGIIAISGDQVDPARIEPMLADLGVAAIYRQLSAESTSQKSADLPKKKHG